MRESPWGDLREAFKVLGIFTTLWYRTGYQPLMKLAHRYGWHYAPTNHLEDGSTQRWCHWCGMRATELRRIHVEN